MGLLAKLRRHGPLAVCAAMALWVTQPAMAALCPCALVAVADAAGSATAGGADDARCCGGCCPPAAVVKHAKPAASPNTAACPLRGADFLLCAVVPEVAATAKPLPAVPGDGFVEPPGFFLCRQSPRAPGVDTGPPGPTLSRALARLVATRCHPVHAPPVS